ncbi:MAG: MHYT domain-containing protein, partial [Terriglobia bacterium]
MGIGIWSMHFIGMLAFSVPIPLRYNVLVTLASLAIAVLTSGFALGIAGRRDLSLSRLAVGSVIMGAGICAMHYTGMAALRGPFILTWDSNYVAASIVLGAALAALAVFLSRSIRGLSGAIASAAALTLAIVAMHFTAMTAATLVMAPVVDSGAAILDPSSLAIAVAAVGILIITLGLTGAQLDSHLTILKEREEDRLRQHISELEATQAHLAATLAEAEAANA